jgi:hypothetical protein
MAKDVKDAGDVIGAALGTIAREVSHSVSRNGHSKVPFRNGSDNGLSGPRGIAAGAVLAGAAPLAGNLQRRPEPVAVGLLQRVESLEHPASRCLGADPA